MDRYSELEAKYEAHAIPISAYLEKMKVFNAEKYHCVIGWDTFYSNPSTGLVLRYRRAKSEGNDHPVLTFKKRKDGGNSVDREEVDLFLERNDATDDDAKAFLGALGLKEHFSILKESHIHHIVRGDHIAVVALYDVMQPGQHGLRRFLEVEIDKDSECDATRGHEALRFWEAELESRFDIKAPLNKSLYELYAPFEKDAKLYIKGTF